MVGIALFGWSSHLARVIIHASLVTHPTARQHHLAMMAQHPRHSTWVRCKWATWNIPKSCRWAVDAPSWFPLIFPAVFLFFPYLRAWAHPSTTSPSKVAFETASGSMVLDSTHCQSPACMKHRQYMPTKTSAQLNRAGGEDATGRGGGAHNPGFMMNRGLS